MVERRQMSISQFSELMGIEPQQFLGVEVSRMAHTVTVLVESDDAELGNIPATVRQHTAEAEQRR